MMDEIREYEEYIGDIKTESVRFNSGIFKGRNFEMKGLKRALTIISRKELNDRGFFSDEYNNKEKIINEVKEVLIKWTGFSEECEDSWLKEYCNSIMQNTEKFDWDKIRKQKGDDFKKDLYKSNSHKNDLLEVTYEKVIADAIYFGPLKKYYLVCKEESSMKIKKVGKKINLANAKAIEQVDHIFKLIAVYLIQKRYTGNQYNYINYAEIGHWTQSKEVTKGKEYFLRTKDKDVIKFTYDNEAIYTCQDTKAGNVAKICVSPAYMRDADFQIVESSQFKGVPEGYTFYSDQGVGELQEKKFYETP